MHTILGIGNALTDILAVLPDDSFLKLYHLPKGNLALYGKCCNKSTSHKSHCTLYLGKQ